jgi:ketosteroid isomerase-like protein
VIPPGFRPLDIEPRAHRSVLERAALRYRAVHRAGALLLDRLPPGRLRRLYLERLILPYSYGTLNRRDLRALAALYFAEDIVMRFGGDRPPGFQAEFTGHDDAMRAYGELMDDWGALERKPVAYAERGDLLIVLVRQHTEGSASGLSIDVEIGQVYRLRGGIVAEYVEYRSWAEAIAHED